jgi:hypothetical protein
MRMHRGIAVVLIAAALALPARSTAQRFQEPTKEELQMTVDPKAPGAPAVFLYREVSTDNHNHTVSNYARIKVLTELGKEWATVEVPYIPGFTAEPIIEGRTIHSDGTVIPLVGKASEVLVFKSHKNHVKAAVFNLPSVEVGSILEYKWTIPLTGGKVVPEDDGESDNYWASSLANSVPEWDVQQEIFVHKEHFFYNPFSEQGEDPTGGHGGFTYFIDGERATFLLHTQRLPAGTKVVANLNGDFFLDIQDVPGFEPEANTPPENSFHYRVRFFFSPYPDAQTYWSSEVKRWSRQVDLYADPTRSIRDAASQIVTGADTAESKARKLYDAVQGLENTDFSREKSTAERKQLHLKKEIKKAQDVWDEKSGSGNDLAALYLALARAAGLSADGLQVVDRDQRIFDANLLSLHQLDSLLVVLHINGNDIYLDPGEKLCPFGQLHWKHTLAGGLEENVTGPVYTPQNVSKSGITARSADLTLDATGAITGTIKILMNGPEALRWRQLNLTADAEEVKKQFNESLRELLPEGVAGEVDRFQGLDTSATNLLAVVKVTGSVGTITGKRMMVPGFFFSTNAHTQFVAEQKRENAVDLHYAEQAIDDVVYHLPPSFAVESAPSEVQLPWLDHAAVVVKTTPGTGSIEIKRIYARAFVLLEAKDYPALRDFYQKIAANDQQRLVLTQAVSGN